MEILPEQKITYIYPPSVQKMLEHYGKICDDIFEKAKERIRTQHLTPRQMQRIQEKVVEDIKPFVDEMVRLREVVLPKIEIKL